MKKSTEEPTPDQLLVMAYLDDELQLVELRRFEARLQREPRLRREFARQARTDELLRRCSAPRPATLPTPPPAGRVRPRM